jgi:GNAT superfamily N-acetyltransferase
VAKFDQYIRPAGLADRDFIVSLLPRLVEFGPPPWRDSRQMTAADASLVDEVLRVRPPDDALLIAEDGCHTPLGYIHLNTGRDYITGEEHDHISNLAVVRAGEGRGVGRALLAATEDWARGRGYRLLTLNVFVANRRAREVYEKLGYGEETVKCVKKLN